MEIFLMEKTDMALIILDVQVHMFSPENPVYQGEHLLEKIGHLQEAATSVSSLSP
jgi:nicotinamidase-related amidase